MVRGGSCISRIKSSHVKYGLVSISVKRHKRAGRFYTYSFSLSLAGSRRSGINGGLPAVVKNVDY